MLELTTPKYEAYQYRENLPRECNVQKHLKDWNKKLNRDKAGNLFLFKPNTILLCAHMDTVGDYEDQWYVKNVRIEWEWDDRIIIWDGNIWADDKCGIAIAMELYEQYPDRFSLLFTVGEETGWIGVRAFIEEHKELLNMINYCVIADRRWDWDIIGMHNEYCSQKFDEVVEGSLSQFGYKSTVGVRCDADYLSDHMNCINLSCGYYWAHTSKEYVVIEEFINCYNAIEHLSTVFNEKMPKPTKYQGYWRAYWYWPEVYGDEPAIEVFWEDMIITRKVQLVGPDWTTINLDPWEYYIRDFGKSSLDPLDEVGYFN